MEFVVMSLAVIGFFASMWRFVGYRQKQQWKVPKAVFPKDWRDILIRKVAYYNALSIEEKNNFEYKIHEFLLNYRITGIDVKIDDVDRILTAASAVIPIFAFPDWRYFNLSEVLIYPSEFNLNFETAGPHRGVQGMVGRGSMTGKMILSKPALRKGFENETDKHNVAIHEFVHLIDMSDGSVDGLPQILMKKQYALPWLNLIDEKIREIKKGETKINPYGTTNKAEFFAVLSEYFFERPKLLEKNQPELYKMMETIFHQDMAERDLFIKKNKTNRNDPCPCGSGKKFKYCCGKIHYS